MGDRREEEAKYYSVGMSYKSERFISSLLYLSFSPIYKHTNINVISPVWFRLTLTQSTQLSFFFWRLDNDKWIEDTFREGMSWGDKESLDERLIKWENERKKLLICDGPRAREEGYRKILWGGNYEASTLSCLEEKYKDHEWILKESKVF